MIEVKRMVVRADVLGRKDIRGIESERQRKGKRRGWDKEGRRILTDSTN